MKTKHYFLFALGLLLAPTYLAQSQEPKPAQEQCRIDAQPFIKAMLVKPNDQNALFMAQRDYLNRLPLSEVIRRETEMYDCITVDPKNTPAYQTLHLVLDAEETSRYMSFLLRHQMMEQFRAEDANGAR